MASSENQMNLSFFFFRIDKARPAGFLMLANPIIPRKHFSAIKTTYNKKRTE